MRLSRAIVVALVLAFSSPLTFVAAQAKTGAAPRTVVTIKPIHALVAGVMAGVGEPVLLVTGGASPHMHAMKPSSARALATADLVIWVGPAMESFFIKPAQSIPASVTLVTLIDSAALHRLKARRGGAWDDHHDDEHDNNSAKPTRPPGDDEIDAHLWLDPANGRAIVALVAETLSRLDPGNGEAYRANAKRLIAELTDLQAEISATLEPVRRVPYVVFHDAYQYFEARFGTNALASISLSPGRSPSARRLYEIRGGIRQSGAVCVFAEPQFMP
ncbi:MAG: zinc ABC transporter substrate-binding protein, partial [Proteobacteria bacterium]|nr:zinc ABC transporter substrate-binding protein [Pseudomonadota bacterium]